MPSKKQRSRRRRIREEKREAERQEGAKTPSTDTEPTDKPVKKYGTKLKPMEVISTAPPSLSSSENAQELVPTCKYGVIGDRRTKKNTGSCSNTGIGNKGENMEERQMFNVPSSTSSVWAHVKLLGLFDDEKKGPNVPVSPGSSSGIEEMFPALGIPEPVKLKPGRRLYQIVSQVQGVTERQNDDLSELGAAALPILPSPLPGIGLIKMESSSDEGIFSNGTDRSIQDWVNDLVADIKAEAPLPSWYPWQSFDYFSENIKRESRLQFGTSTPRDLAGHIQGNGCINEPTTPDMQDPPLLRQNMSAVRIPPLHPYPMMTPENPGVEIILYRTNNFANLVIQFAVRAYNWPLGFTVNRPYIDALVTTPSGLQLPCHMNYDVSFPVDAMHGSFRATDEVGVYRLMTRLILPAAMGEKGFKLFRSRFGVLGDAIDVHVSHNYYRNSHMVPSTAYLLRSTLNGTDFFHGRDMKAWGITCDKHTNRIFYTDRSSHQITCMDPRTGIILFQFEQSRETCLLNRPTGICCDEVNRRVVVADKDNHRICLFSMDGEYINSFGDLGHENGMFDFPWDVEVDPYGQRIAVADSRNRRVQLFDLYGNYLDKYSIYERNPFLFKGNFEYPRGICFGPDGKHVFCTDFNTDNVLKIPVDMSNSEGIRLCPEGSLSRPQGVFADDIGNLLVADTKNHCIRHLNGSGDLLSTIRHVGANPVEFPADLTSMGAGYVALMDGLGRIYIF